MMVATLALPSSLEEKSDGGHLPSLPSSLEEKSDGGHPALPSSQEEKVRMVVATLPPLFLFLTLSERNEIYMMTMATAGNRTSLC